MSGDVAALPHDAQPESATLRFLQRLQAQGR